MSFFGISAECYLGGEYGKRERVRQEEKEILKIDGQRVK
jgi:hypothetical protein